jgi:hypothetical protein
VLHIQFVVSLDSNYIFASVENKVVQISQSGVTTFIYVNRRLMLLSRCAAVLVGIASWNRRGESEVSGRLNVTV